MSASYVCLNLPLTMVISVHVTGHMQKLAVIQAGQAAFSSNMEGIHMQS